jgi:hypothetical protein
MTREVLCVVTVLLSHQIDYVEPGDDALGNVKNSLGDSGPSCEASGFGAAKGGASGDMTGGGNMEPNDTGPKMSSISDAIEGSFGCSWPPATLIMSTSPVESARETLFGD